MELWFQLYSKQSFKLNVHLRSPDIKWSHEDASEMLLEHLIEENNIEIEKDQLNFINGLIRGDRRTNYEHDWVYEVVSSKKTGLDMDRFDYMRRDPLHLGQ